jgi:hypothetical protein
MKRLITLFAMTVVLVAQAEGQMAATPPDPWVGAADSAVTDSTKQTPQVPYTVDAWGQRKDYALALGEVLLVNGIVWLYNEYPRGANFTQINPRSWYNNLSGGWTYDDNHFANNQFAHPFHGSLYYSAARANGFNYWVSLPTALLGSAFWECCGETHPPAINDWIATGVGGSAIGEMLYRVSSTVLDNTATGSERVWREIGAGLLNPVRGFTRLVTGQVGKVQPNPENPLDHIPNVLLNTLRLGGRWVADSGSLDEGGGVSESNAYTGMVEVDFQFGSPFAAERRKPFDFFSFRLGLYSREKKALALMLIRGNLWATDLKRSEGNQLVLGVAHNFEYINNNAMEFGATSATLFLASRWPVSDKFGIVGELGADGYLMTAINSELAFLAVVPDTSRFREYDYGIGAGVRAQLQLRLFGRRFVEASYRTLYSNTLNGSSGTLEGGTVDTWHILQALRVGMFSPRWKNFGVGVDFLWYRRDSHFNRDELMDLTQKVRELRAFVTWEVGRGIGTN